MAESQQEQKIGENTYVVRMFGAKKGRTVLFRLSKMLGPAMTGLINGGFSGQGLVMMLSSFAESAKEEDFEFLCDSFADVTKVKRPVSSGEAIVLDLSQVFDDHFRGHYGEMIQWLGFAIRVNFESFLPEMVSGGGTLAGLLEAIGIRLAAAKPGSKSPPE